MRKIYIDVDGVLLGKEHNNSSNVVLAEGVNEFIDFVLKHFDCYWLTTHCRGNNRNVLAYLRRFTDDQLHSKLKKIKPTNFDVFKTEALDEKDDFILVDDSLLQGEIDWLEKHSKLESWLQVNTYLNPKGLIICLETYSKHNN